MIDSDFLAAVEGLSVPEMGTDNLAPLLYWLVRAVRPTRLLEVGMGYTTAFLARALADNAAAIADERALLAAHPDRFPLGHAPYYEQPYRPKLVCVDRMTHATSSAPRVLQLLGELGLAGSVEVIEGELDDSSDRVRDALGLIDFAWIDTWDTLAFVRDYWDAIDPAGGILAIHWLMTYPQGRAVLQYLQSMRSVEGGRLELFGFREPHKNAQNSLTLVRRVRDYQDPEDMRPTGTLNDPSGTLTGRR